MSKIVVRNGSEIFYALGSRVYTWVSGSLPHNTDITPKKSLNLPQVQSNIESMSLNQAGTFLAINCTTELFVVKLPANGFLKSSSLSLEVSCFQIGSDSFDEDTSVIKCVWSPISKYNSCLVVLTSNKSLYTFDMSISHREPLDVYFLTSESSEHSKSSTAISATDANEEMQDPVDICFGSSAMNDPVGCLTLYIFTGEGDLYILYPFAPPEISVPPEFVQKLCTITDSMFEKIHKQSLELGEFSSVSEDELVALKYKELAALSQLKWTKNLATLASDCQREFKNTLTGDSSCQEYLTITLDITKSMYLNLQGPIHIQQMPSLIMDDYSIAGTSICTMSDGYLSFIALGFSNGQALILFKDPDMLMQWHHEGMDMEEASYFLCPEMSLCHHLSFKAKKEFSVTDFTMFRSEIPGLIFAKIESSDKSQSLLKVDLYKWAESLSTADLESGENSEIQDAEITVLGVGERVLGAGIVSFGESDYVLFNVDDTLTKHILYPPRSPNIGQPVVSESMQAMQRMLEQKLVFDPPTGAASLPHIKELNFSKSLLLEPEIKESLFTKLLPISGDSVDADDFNANLLIVMDKVVQKTVSQIINMVKGQSELEKTLVSSKFRLHTHLQKLNEIIEKQNSLKLGVKDLSRLDDIKQRQEILKSKLNKLQEKLQKLEKLRKSKDGSNFTGNLPLSESEKKFFNEIERTKLMFHDLSRESHGFKRQLSFVKTSIKDFELTNRPHSKEVEETKFDGLKAKLENYGQDIELLRETVVRGIEVVDENS